ELQQFNESIAKAGEVFTAERIMNLYASSNWSLLDSFTFSVNLMHAWTKFANYVAVETYRNQVKNTLKRWNNPKHKDTALDAHTERLFNYYGMGRAEALEWFRGGMRKDHPMYERYQNGAVTF